MIDQNEAMELWEINLFMPSGFEKNGLDYIPQNCRKKVMMKRVFFIEIIFFYLLVFSCSSSGSYPGPCLQSQCCWDPILCDWDGWTPAVWRPWKGKNFIKSRARKFLRALSSRASNSIQFNSIQFIIHITWKLPSIVHQRYKT